MWYINMKVISVLNSIHIGEGVPGEKKQYEINVLK